jgi:hypothetical protein
LSLDTQFVRLYRLGDRLERPRRFDYRRRPTRRRGRQDRLERPFRRRLRF